jgi:ribokinase
VASGAATARVRPEPQRRAFVFTDANAERTITVMGDRVGPHGDDSLPWSELAGIDGVYFTAGDADAVRAARAVRTLVSTARAIEPLARAGVQIDMLVSSSRDVGERYTPGDIDPPPRLVARTAGAAGGWVEAVDGAKTHWTAGPPRRSPARRSTPTARATASPPVSRTGWQPVARARRPSRSARGVARHA